ncbi:MAG: hypothetical protein EXS05_23275, partial [Planctomycetaceae bacterium]|nr:hypothetical protein [Planctomycetaceae bacterium]
MSGYSKKETSLLYEITGGALGEARIQNYDNSDNKIGYSTNETSLFGGSYTQSWTQDGTKDGYSTKETSKFGTEYIQHSTQGGSKDGYSEDSQTLMRDYRQNHYSQGDHKEGHSDFTGGIISETRKRHHGVEQGRPRPSSATSAASGSASSSANSSGDGSFTVLLIGLFAVAIVGAIAIVNVGFNDPNRKPAEYYRLELGLGPFQRSLVVDGDRNVVTEHWYDGDSVWPIDSLEFVAVLNIPEKDDACDICFINKYGINKPNGHMAVPKKNGNIENFEKVLLRVASQTDGFTVPREVSRVDLGARHGCLIPLSNDVLLSRNGDESKAFHSGPGAQIRVSAGSTAYKRNIQIVPPPSSREAGVVFTDVSNAVLPSLPLINARGQLFEIV